MKKRVQTAAFRLEKTISHQIDTLYAKKLFADLIDQIKLFITKHPDYAYHLNLTSFIRDCRTHRPVRCVIVRNLMGQMLAEPWMNAEFRKMWKDAKNAEAKGALYKKYFSAAKTPRMAHVMFGASDMEYGRNTKFCAYCSGTGLATKHKRAVRKRQI